MYDYLENRHGELSIRAYNVIIGLILLWGLVINILMCKFCTDMFMSWNFTAVVIVSIIVAIVGIMMSALSSNTFISFIGYNLVVLPVGVISSIVLTGFDQISIMNALVTTSIVTITMIVLASIIPNVFLSTEKVLFACLTGVLICEFIFILIGFFALSLWNFGIALMFCCYIGYDWAKAQTKKYTLYNAVYSVVDLYLNIIILFWRILSVRSKSNKEF